MKLIATMLIAACLFASSYSQAQTVTISVKDARLETVLNQVKKQTGHTFFYNESLLKNAGKVTMTVQNATIADALNACFASQPLLEYTIIGTTVVIKEKADAKSTVESIINNSISITLTGKVVNQRGERLNNANVSVKRTHRGVITNTKGDFSIDNIKANDTLIVSYVGYKTLEVAVDGQLVITITLKEATNQLDEVVIQAYSTTSQRLTTGNITKITASEIEKQPVMNPLLALQGRVPGLVVTPTSGFASAPMKMEIRGLNSLNSSVPSDPLYVIDGVPLTILSLGTSYNRISTGFIQSIGYNSPSGVTTNGQSPLFSINPADIESIEVLKDADATAVYGARGSNGVILITTKKGKPGKTKFDFNINPPFLSIGKTTRYVKTMNTQQYLQMRQEAFKNDGIVPTLFNAPDLLFWDTTRYTNWQKEIMGGRAKTLEVSAGVSGGSEQTSFRINANYTRLTNTTNISGVTQRATLGANLNSTSHDQKFSFNLFTNFSYSYVNVVTPVFNAILAPNAPSIFDKNGNPNWAEWNVNGLYNTNNNYPFGQNVSPANPQSTTALTSSLKLEYQLFKGVTLSTILGYNFAYNSTNYFFTIASQNPYQHNRTGGANFSTTQNAGWSINPQVTYNTRLGKGNLQVNLVATEQAIATNGINLWGDGYTNDILLGSINNAGTTYTAAASSRAKNASFVGGVNYEWQRKYIINLNGTRQGSSKFGPDNKYGNFGSAGLAWIASEENWLKKNLPSFISFLKFRGSYGLTGSDGVADYQYLALWLAQGASIGGYNGQMTLTPSVRPNQKYQWEENKKLEGAMNISFFKDRLTLNIAYYQNRIINQLTTYPTPAYINSPNVSAIVTNIPLLIQNSGWEGSIEAKLVTSANFSLSASFNISQNKNELISFPDLEKTPYAGQYAIGRPINLVYLFHYLGVDPLTGRATFQDYNNDGKISWNGLQAPPPGSDDRGVVYDLQPKFYGGFGLNGNYKKLSFSFFFTYKKQKAQNIYASSTYTPGTFNQNLPPEIFTGNRWRQPGDIAEYPAFSTMAVTEAWGNITLSDFAYSDASYIRLNNVYLSYPLPEAWGKKIGLKNLTVSLTGQNVLTITRYKGGDPETPGYTLPPANLYTIRFTYNF